VLVVVFSIHDAPLKQSMLQAISIGKVVVAAAATVVVDAAI